MVVIPIRGLVVSDISYIEFDHAPQWEVATGASRCSAWADLRASRERLNSLAAFRFLGQVLEISRFTCMLPGASSEGVYAMIRTKSISFVWASLSKHCIFNALHTIISGTRVYSVCLLSDGEVPETCVSGSGVYRCISVDDRGESVFELRLTYLEVDIIGETYVVKAIIDVANSKPHLPLGLLA